MTVPERLAVPRPLARAWLRRPAIHGAGADRAGWAQMLARGTRHRLAGRTVIRG
jgi:hypothetical protein